MDIYVYTDDKNRVTGWGSTPSPGTQLVGVDDNHEVMEHPMYYVLKGTKLIRDLSWVMDILRKRKDKELNEACEKAILSGFDHHIGKTMYHFSYDMEAQMNFQKKAVLLAKELVDSVDVTAKRLDTGDYEIVEVDLPKMEELEVAQLKHVQKHTRRYRNELLPKVAKAKKIEDIQKIVW